MEKKNDLVTQRKLNTENKKRTSRKRIDVIFSTIKLMIASNDPRDVPFFPDSDMKSIFYDVVSEI